MLHISESQMNALKKAQFERFSLRLLQYIEESGYGEMLPQDTRNDFTYNRLVWLRRLTGFQSEQHLVGLFIMSLVHGSEFFDSASVRKAIDSEYLSERRKYRRIGELANDRKLQQKSGG